MVDMTYWCESCARKSNCYTIRSRPKCFTPITSNDRTADRKTEPQMIDQVKADIEKRSSWSKTYEAICKTEPQTDGYISGEDFMKIFDEPQTERSE